jgi:hypothetical protein
MAYNRTCRFCGKPLAPNRRVSHCPNCTPKKRAAKKGGRGRGKGGRRASGGSGLSEWMKRRKRVRKASRKTSRRTYRRISRRG